MHQYVCLYSRHYYRWIFRSDKNYSSNCQKGKNNTQIPGSYKNDAKPGNHFCSASSFDLPTFWFLKSTPSPFQVLHPISYCHPPKEIFFICFPIVGPPGNPEGRQYYPAGAYSHLCLLLNLQINPSFAFSQWISSAVSHHMLLFPQLFCPLVPLILSPASVAMRMNIKSGPRISQK